MQLFKIYGSGTTALIISNEESGLLTKRISEKIKKPKYGFFPMLLGTLAASISENALSGRGVIRAGERVIRATQSF